MFFDIGPLKLVTLVLLAVIVFGPDKLPKLIQDVARMIRKLRAFSDNAKEDIRKELGPEFKDFEFEDLNPKTFVRKNLLDNDRLGLQEIRNGFDLKDEMATVTDAVQEGRGAVRGATGSDAGPVNGTPSAADPLRKRDPLAPGEPPPFDADAT
ncbi:MULTISPECIES: sec-independent translocase [Streptomycetaceae]|uniref:Sec-independent protein translocase protein TatB n=1 Tax=Streptantibioticus cattleyicolor (strain ATCC 35852 / DSM 46488 / JCM 4925 / NBRC 14057 / NRRL 8057) TaxID=1003195 RepID=F8K3N9_STREN|nr:sec-independent translocase [Streptantibioticus cattleyicolor]AEW96363.1 sec-independent translocase [Streptantibioticus cattleyicolor NRRL 8057 = DSM 46488]MYS60877.1 Sec-independent protein translocase TatB [Streptomyces sp. SID5468]CCB76703.1 Sec-independent protein translocase protein tatB homolog [Streptantibioticus cattleyicolor NRRL 8057 = DSM 46488]